MALEEEIVFRARRTPSGRWTISVDGGKQYGPAQRLASAALLAVEEAERRLRRSLVRQRAALRVVTHLACAGAGCANCGFRGWLEESTAT